MLTLNLFIISLVILLPSYLPSQLFVKMQTLRKQNNQLQQTIQNCLEEIEKQKELNQQHEGQIQTLLKFNQRLLGIIDHELNNNKKDNCSLQPISQRSERQSDMMSPAVQSLFKSKKLAAKSERGFATRNSLVERTTFQGNKQSLFDKDPRHSQINHSFDNQQLSDFQLESSKPSSPTALVQRNANPASSISDVVKEEMSKEINDLKKFKAESVKFYDSKINQIKSLSTKLGTFKPMQKFNQITQKLTLSAGTADMIKKVMGKNG